MSLIILRLATTGRRNFQLHLTANCRCELEVGSCERAAQAGRLFRFCFSAGEGQLRLTPTFQLTSHICSYGTRGPAQAPIPSCVKQNRYYFFFAAFFLVAFFATFFFLAAIVLSPEKE